MVEPDTRGDTQSRLALGTQRPLVLVTNDDGIEAAGLWLLAQAAATVADIVVVAPAKPQSWMGRAHLSEELVHAVYSAPSAAVAWEHLPPVEIPGLARSYAVAASPARCVRVALDALEIQPDLVVSGMNLGSNIGSIVTCSGTLGAAWEAADSGLPAIAFSRPETMPESEAGALVSHMSRVVDRALSAGLPDDVAILSVNFPEGMTSQAPWVVTQTASRSTYGFSARYGAAIGAKVVWELNSFMQERPRVEEGSDVDVLNAGGVSLTFWPARLGAMHRDWLGP